MTIAQFIVAYAVCWWLVLFMLLPAGAAPAPTPEKGHAPSAPANPRLKQKFRWATVLALLPTLLIYLVATNVKAQETIYHVGGGCKKLNKFTPSADLNVRDGYGTGGKQVKPADLEGKSNLINTDSVAIPLEIPSERYVNRAQAVGASGGSPTSINGRNVDLSQSFIEAGKLEVKRDGEALLNGQSITESQTFEEGCGDEK